MNGRADRINAGARALGRRHRAKLFGGTAGLLAAMKTFRPTFSRSTRKNKIWKIVNFGVDGFGRSFYPFAITCSPLPDAISLRCRFKHSRLKLLPFRD